MLGVVAESPDDAVTPSTLPKTTSTIRIGKIIHRIFFLLGIRFLTGTGRLSTPWFGTYNRSYVKFPGILRPEAARHPARAAGGDLAGHQQSQLLPHAQTPTPIVALQSLWHRPAVESACVLVSLMAWRGAFRGAKVTFVTLATSVPKHKAWMPRSCSWNDMAGTSTPYPRGRTGARRAADGNHWPQKPR